MNNPDNFTVEELLELAKANDKSVQIGLAAGPNIKYVRTHLACAFALRIAAEALKNNTHC